MPSIANSTKFSCLRCGCCCRNLRVTLGNYEIGLFLFPQETKLFPVNLIVPQWAINNKGKARPNRLGTIAYQLTSQNCPHITKTNHCQIYKYRPLICRGYPLTVHLNGVADLDLKCQACHKQDLYGSQAEIIKVFGPEMVQAQIQMHRRMRQLFMARAYTQASLYDLKTRKWQTLTQQEIEQIELHTTRGLENRDA